MLDKGRTCPPQWSAFAKQKLPCDLVDILSEPDMFSEQDGDFKNVSYGVAMLTLLHSCMKVAVYHIEHELDEHNYTNMCLNSLFHQREKFYQAMWNKRHLIHAQDQFAHISLALDFHTFSVQAFRCVHTLWKMSEYS
ncbi:hypothetical protein EUX98_g7527 [Antrodiella citrinella]|uniref:ELMO domain-containing protein n=1 Tax=Antrodiella citrinella TaxID=2447956 RepID=A0A4V3XHU4_9APHY|nr:hypothetical protein EUX98_g7527 [Antrodiella citrinella]